MIKKSDAKKVEIKERMRDGDGSVIIEHIIGKDELYEKGRLFAHITLKQNCSIGYHIHEGEMETFYIIKGTATYNDNGTQTKLQIGDVAYTPGGEGHSIANEEPEDLELIALIVNKS